MFTKIFYLGMNNAFNVFSVQSMDWLTNRWKDTQSSIWKFQTFVLPIVQSKACHFTNTVREI